MSVCRIIALFIYECSLHINFVYLFKSLILFIYECSLYINCVESSNIY